MYIVLVFLSFAHGMGTNLAPFCHGKIYNTDNDDEDDDDNDNDNNNNINNYDDDSNNEHDNKQKC